MACIALRNSRLAGSRRWNRRCLNQVQDEDTSAPGSTERDAESQRAVGQHLDPSVHADGKQLRSLIIRRCQQRELHLNAAQGNARCSNRRRWIQQQLLGPGWRPPVRHGPPEQDQPSHQEGLSPARGRSAPCSSELHPPKLPLEPVRLAGGIRRSPAEWGQLRGHRQPGSTQGWQLGHEVAKQRFVATRLPVP